MILHVRTSVLLRTVGIMEMSFHVFSPNCKSGRVKREEPRWCEGVCDCPVSHHSACFRSK